MTTNSSVHLIDGVEEQSVEHGKVKNWKFQKSGNQLSHHELEIGNWKSVKVREPYFISEEPTFAIQIGNWKLRWSESAEDLFLIEIYSFLFYPSIQPVLECSNFTRK